jgi:hypothetical protein
VIYLQGQGCGCNCAAGGGEHGGGPSLGLRVEDVDRSAARARGCIGAASEEDETGGERVARGQRGGGGGRTGGRECSLRPRAGVADGRHEAAAVDTLRAGGR